MSTSEREGPYPRLPEDPGGDDDLAPTDDERATDVEPEDEHTYGE